MAVRIGLQDDLHRLANLVECQIADLFRELLIESRPEAAQSIAYSGCSFIESLRSARDGEGGEG